MLAEVILVTEDRPRCQAPKVKAIHSKGPRQHERGRAIIPCTTGSTSVTAIDQIVGDIFPKAGNTELRAKALRCCIALKLGMKCQTIIT
jgi:hypothetical protein